MGGLDLNGDARRRGREGGGKGGGHKNLFCFFVPTVAFQRYQIAGASSALGVVSNSFWDRPWSVLWRAAFLFFTPPPPPRCTFPSPPSPSRVFLIRMYACVGTHGTRRVKGKISLAAYFLNSRDTASEIMVTSLEDLWLKKKKYIRM